MPWQKTENQRYNDWKIWEIAEGHNGDLTELGGLQHKQISQRMFKNNPQAFGNNAIVTAKSTVVPRCIISMAYLQTN
jgi:NDP-sugar pyrophosphorylase family protein